MPTPLKTKLEAALVPAKPAVAITEAFPADLKLAFALLEEIKKIEPKNEVETENKAARISALMRHIHVIQQGLPVIPSKSTDHQSRHRSVMRLHKLDRLAANSPEVRGWLERAGITY
jgi:hypothetical protein